MARFGRSEADKAAALLSCTVQAGMIWASSPATEARYGGGAWPGSVDSDEGYHMDVTDWPGVAGVGRTEAPKLTLCCCQTAPARQLLGCLPATPRLCGGGAWPGIVVSDEGYHLDVADWPGLAGVGRTEGEKMVAQGCKVVWADTSGPLSGDLQLLRRWLLVVAC